MRRDIRYLAWDRAFEWPVVGWLIGRLGAVPVKLDRGGTLSSLRVAIKVLKSGASLMVFPEGSREFSDGKFLPFKSGAAHLARKTGCHILPVTINGGNRVWPRGNRFPRPGKVDIYFHPTIEFDETAVDEKIAIADTTRRIESLIAGKVTQSKQKTD